MFPFRRQFLLSAALTAGALACGSDNPADVPARSLEITVVTSGDEPDSDGYTVQIDSENSRPLRPSEVIQHRDISPGDHTIYVGGVADNCSVQGANPKTVSVPAAGTVAITIEIVCAARAGSVLVTVLTQGLSTFPIPHTVAIDGIERAALDTGRVLLSGIPPGMHQIQLRGLAEHCTTQGNPRPVTVRAVEITRVEFWVLCASLQAILEITTSPLGYQYPGDLAFSVDGGPAMRLPSGAIGTLDVYAGDHSVELLQIPPSCRVAAPNPYRFNLPAGGRGRVNFTMSSDPFAGGSLHVSVVTRGSALDPDGYQLILDGGTRYDLRPLGRVVIQDLSPGYHLIALLGLSGNCRVEGEDRRTVFVPIAGVAEEDYLVACSD
jgi:hypothetical protein